MLALVVGVPGLIASTTFLVRRLPPKMINLPNKSYWLAPERRAATLEALASLSLRFAQTLAVFLCFVHWLVVRANAVQPPKLPESWLFVGLAGFGAVMLGWLFVLCRRFGRVP
jgi:serine/threonine-protein kinase